MPKGEQASPNNTLDGCARAFILARPKQPMDENHGTIHRGPNGRRRTAGRHPSGGEVQAWRHRAGGLVESRRKRRDVQHHDPKQLQGREEWGMEGGDQLQPYRSTRGRGTRPRGIRGNHPPEAAGPRSLNSRRGGPLTQWPVLLSRTPGWPSSRNSTPTFSSVPVILASVSVLATTGPSNPSIRFTVPKATRDFLESSICVQPTRARAARMCLPVMEIKARRYHERHRKPKQMN